MVSVGNNIFYFFNLRGLNMKNFIDLSEFNVITYPDGHKHIKHDMDLHKINTLSASIKTFDDLFLIAQIKQIYPELAHLFIKYLLAARCDRKFSRGEAVDLKIVCDYIKNLGFKKATVLNPHNSNATKESFNGYDVYFKSAYLFNDLLKIAKNKINNSHHVLAKKNGAPDYIALFPDYGSCSLYPEIDELPLSFFCEKTRDETGAPSVALPKEAYEHESVIIIDDLCDGGATFTSIAKKIKEKNPTCKIYLIVTHAIFSKGIDIFDGLIEHIYCTDSFAKFNHPLVTQIEATTCI